MAKIIGIYNNKGGVGKTTLTVFLADVLSSVSIKKQKPKVLVIDFDPQSSCASALLGSEMVEKIQAADLTLSNALLKKLENEPVSYKDYVHTRPEAKVKTRKTKLGWLDVMLCDPQSILQFDQRSNFSLTYSLRYANELRKSFNSKYDFILVDFPGNISKLNTFSLIGACLSDYFIVPVEPNRMNTNAFKGTIEMFANLKKWRKTSKFKVLGLILNKVDKRTKQYKEHNSVLADFANQLGCKVYENGLPQAPKLADAADDSIEYTTLTDKFDSYQPHVRKIVKEMLHDLGYVQRS